MQTQVVRTAGETVAINCELPWLERVLSAAADGTSRSTCTVPPTVTVNIERTDEAFDISGWAVLTRDALAAPAGVVIRDVCGSGFDILVTPAAGHLTVVARWRPPARTRFAATVLRGRAELLTRAVLLQYPAIWWAGRRGFAPLHAPACASADGACVLLAGPGGVGKSTLVFAELAADGTATSDNLAVSDGEVVHGVIEPGKIEGGSGPRRPHGRREVTIAARSPALTPNQLWVVGRGRAAAPSLTPLDTDAATRALVAGTYMAGELRRYWSYAATLALGTNVGPAHPAVETVARKLADRLPCWQLTLGRTPPANPVALSAYRNTLLVGTGAGGGS